MKSYAYATIITKDYYLPFIIRQKQMMDYLNCKYPFIVLISNEISENTKNELSSYNITYKTIKKVSFTHENLNKYKDTLNKFQCFNLIEYEKILFLDADIIISKNFDFLLETIELKNTYFYLPIGNNECASSHEGHFYCSYIMLLKPSIDFFNKIISIATKNPCDSDEAFLNQNPQFTKNAFNKKFEENISGEHLIHFCGLHKLHNNPDKNNFLNQIFDYKNFNKTDFCIFILNYKFLLFDCLLDKETFSDYNCYLECKINLSYVPYLLITYLKQEIDLCFLLRLYERINYLQIKSNFLVLIADTVSKETIQIIQNNNINYTIISDNINNYNFIQKHNQYEKIIFFDCKFLPKNNFDCLFKDKSINYFNKNNIFKIINPKQQHISNNKKNSKNIQIFLEYNFIYLDSNLISYKEEPSINNLFFKFSTLQFNQSLDNYWRDYKMMNNAFKNYYSKIQYINNLFNSTHKIS